MRVLLIDGMNLIRRIYAGVPADANDVRIDEDVLNAARRSLIRGLEQVAPTHALMACEARDKTWRHQLHPPYKADRKPMPEGLETLLPRIEAQFQALHVRAVRVPGYEADDVIASVAVRLKTRRPDVEVVVLSTDKGLLPLLDHGVRVRNHFEERELTETYVVERFGVPPSALPVYFALVGDRSQGIPGVRSIGAKTAAKLVQAYGGLDAILAASATLPARTATALRNGETDARLSLQLVSMRQDVDIGLNLSACRLSSPEAT